MKVSMQHEYSKVDVLIVGAGPVGMVLACELIRHGLSVKVIDKSPTTKQYSRAPVFWPRAQEALELMQLHHLWEGTYTTLRRMNVNVYGKPAGIVHLDACESSKPVPIMVGQDVTEQILDSHLGLIGNPVARSVEAESIEMHANGVKAWLRHTDGSRQMVKAGWIIGCDGTNSMVRDAVKIQWEGRALKGLMVPVADAKAKWSLPEGDGDAYVALTEQGYLLAIPMPELWRVIVATPDTTAPGETPTTTLDGVAQLTSEAIGGPVELSEPKWVSVVRYGNYMAPTFRAGRALLAGDAAHSIAPLSGQGMNVGVQDAFDLAWKLAYVHKGWSDDSLLDTFTADRKPVAARLVAFTNRFFDRVLAPGRVQRTVAKFVAPRALKRARIRKKIAGFYTGTDICYPESPLNDVSTGRLPAPGSFARDADVVAWEGFRPMRFFEALDGLKWSIVLFSGAGFSPASMFVAAEDCRGIASFFGMDRIQVIQVIGAASATNLGVSRDSLVLVDPWRRLHDKYSASKGAIVVIRPDGYLAMNAPLDDRSLDRVKSLIGKTMLGNSAPGALNGDTPKA